MKQTGSTTYSVTTVLPFICLRTEAVGVIDFGAVLLTVHLMKMLTALCFYMLQNPAVASSVSGIFVAV